MFFFCSPSLAAQRQNFGVRCANVCVWKRGKRKRETEPVQPVVVRAKDKKKRRNCFTPIKRELITNEIFAT